ncbi:MAG: glycosyltransferase family 4 protein [Caldilineaceae bacterium]|nr:glycosyltransferase family 4 protein [Caldilineaceae bacterium]
MSEHNPQQGASGRRHRVLFIAPTSFFADYGCHVRILEEARVLQNLGHHVTIATYRNGRDLPELTIERTLPIPWRRDYEVGSSRHKIAFDALLGLKTLALLIRRRFDVIHAHLHEGALIGVVLGKLAGLPVVFDFQGSLTEEMIDHNFLARDGRVYGPLRRLERWIDHRPAAIFTSSANAAQLLRDDFACPPAKIRPLPDCVNTDVFVPAAAYDAATLAALRSRLGIPPEAKVIAYLGLLAEYQGISHLLEATRRIVAARPDVYLLLMGFPGVDAYRGKAEAMGISGNVRFTGRVPYELAPIHLALGDVAAAPKLSLTEGAGKLLNYMSLAMPTVAYDTAVAREYLGPHGLLAPRGDIDALTAQLMRALDDPAAAQMGQALRQRAIQQYDWRRAGQMIVATYEETLGLTPPPIRAVSSNSVNHL